MAKARSKGRKRSSAGKKSLEHVGHRIEIGDQDDVAEVTIDGKVVEVVSDSDADRLLTPELPYQTYETAEELAKAVAEARGDVSRAS